MKIRIVTVGKASEPAIAPLVAEYEKRLSRWAEIQWQYIPHGRDADHESDQILRGLRDNELVILLDERGVMIANEELVEKLETWLSSGKQLVFVIGGAFGVSPALRDRANYVWSFSKQVFPHQLMRVLLAEQLYRTFSLRAGGKYHHS